MMRMSFSALFGLTLMLLTSSAFAAKYGTAGCGLGSLIIKDKPGMIQILGATLNGTGSQTSAITTGSSNCRQSRSETASLYIIINHVALQRDIANGQGETLSSLAEIYGCQNVNDFATSLNSNFNAIYPSSNAEAKDASKNIYTIIEKDNKFKSCQIFEKLS